jgi:hypothetical protein
LKRVVYIFLFLANIVFSQTKTIHNVGFTTGVVLNLGTHVNSIGVIFKSYYTEHFYQVNAGTSFVWNLTSYGHRKKFFENRTYLGAVLLGGKKDNLIDYQLDGLSHQTTFRNGLGYNYLWYFDKAGTTQLSGGFSLFINKVSILFENDVFGGQANDRYRTGHLLVNYRYHDFKFGTGLYLWTGETNGANWNRESSKDCPYGFKDLSQLPFGKTSHGIWYGSVIGNLGFGQTVQFKIGADSEQIRNSIQNRLIHDLIFLPKTVKHNTPHYPRLNQDGLPVFDKTSRRKDLFYFQSGLNSEWSN